MRASSTSQDGARTYDRQRPRQLGAVEQAREGVLAPLLGQLLHHLQGAVCQVKVHYERHHLAARATGQARERAAAARRAGGRCGQRRGGCLRVQWLCVCVSRVLC